MAWERVVYGYRRGLQEEKISTARVNKLRGSYGPYKKITRRSEISERKMGGGFALQVTKLPLDGSRRGERWGAPHVSA